MSAALRYIFGKYLDPITGIFVGIFTFLQFEKTNNIPENRRIMYNVKKRLGYNVDTEKVPTDE